MTTSILFSKRNRRLTVLIMCVLPLSLWAQVGFNVSQGNDAGINGYLTIGNEESAHLAMDWGLIQSKTASNYGQLLLNWYGGSVNFCQNRSIFYFSGLKPNLYLRNQFASLQEPGALQIGDKAYANLAIDSDDIMARYDGNPHPLYLNREGGPVLTGGNFSVEGKMYANGLQNIGDWSNMQYNTITGEIGYDNSSRRYKSNISTFQDDWNRILEVAPVQYNRQASPDHTEIGYLAESLDSLGITALVGYDNQGLPFDVRYDRFVLYIVEILKIQQHQLEQQTQLVNALLKESSHVKGKDH